MTNFFLVNTAVQPCQSAGWKISSVENRYFQNSLPPIFKTFHSRILFRILNVSSDFYKGWCLIQIYTIRTWCLEIGHNI